MQRTAWGRTAAAVLSMGLMAAAAQAQTAVKIGCLLPLTGGSASVGNQLRVGITAAADQINQAGGIKAMGGARLNVLFADSQSKADVGVSETERLIKSENVSVMCGAFNSAVTFPSTEVAERNKTPWIVASAVKDEITERNFKYVYRPNNKASFDSREVVDGLELLKKETGKGPSRIALFYEGSDWGRSFAANIKKLGAQLKYEVVFDEAAPPNQTDFTSQLLKIRGAKPDALIVAFYTPDQLLLTKQLAEQRLELPYGLWSAGGGTEDPSFYKAVDPKQVAYYFVQEDYQIDILEVNPQPAYVELDKKTQAALGHGLNAYVAQGYSNVYVIADALERARSADRDKIRDALAATDITSGPALITGYQRIQFDEQGQNTHAHGVISENIGGKRRTVWPADSRAKDTRPVWPVPAWSKR